jgi:hypothetical protein
MLCPADGHVSVQLGICNRQCCLSGENTATMRTQASGDAAAAMACQLTDTPYLHMLAAPPELCTWLAQVSPPQPGPHPLPAAVAAAAQLWAAHSGPGTCGLLLGACVGQTTA